MLAVVIARSAGTDGTGVASFAFALCFRAAGLSWEDVDLRHGVAHIRRSFHYRELCKPKTRTARRTIELHPRMVEHLRDLRPLRPEPGQPVFPNLDGRRISPRVFWDTWKRCLQDCRIRHRGL